jgi:glycosyltransferase involved in cell wall biosynthesis
MTSVSAIIPTYNGASFIARAIGSALAQTKRSDDIVVVDDASTDGTADLVAARFPQVRLLRLERNVGSGAARNLGIAASIGEVIAFLDHDDAWHPGYVDAQAKVMDFDPRIVLSRTAVLAVDTKTGETTRFGVAAMPPRHEAIEQFLFGPSPFVTLSAIAVRRSAMDRVGWFDPSLRLLNDRDLYLRLFDAGRFAGVATTLCTKYQHEGNYLYDNQGATWLTESLRIIERYLEQPGYSEFRALKDSAVNQIRARVARAVARRSGTG